MKKIFVPVMSALALMLVLNGCASFSLGGGSKTTSAQPTLGQQLIDLQKARNSGAISEVEYQNQKARLLNQR